MEKTKTRGPFDRDHQKEENRKILWNSRLALLKRAQILMQNKLYGEAAVTYEKYIKILEIVFGSGSGGLTPEHFKQNARTNELPVVASVFWDLVRIYDANSSLLARQKQAADKLAKFVTYTALYGEIMRKAVLFQKQARHPEVIKKFLEISDYKKSRCFVATSAFETPQTSEVVILRHFRDEKLKSNSYGRKFIYFYYQHSPAIAEFLDEHKEFKPPVRFFIRLLIKIVT